MDIDAPALLDGALTFVISHPLARIAQEALVGMVRAVSPPNEGGTFTTILPFEIYTRKNVAGDLPTQPRGPLSAPWPGSPKSRARSRALPTSRPSAPPI